jgi:DNA replication protein DnaC
MRRPCACELANRHKQREAEERREEREAHIKWTYEWLGPRWDDRALARKTFEVFDASRQPVAYESVRLFVLHMKGTLVLHGTFGTGKTHLLAALCNELRNCDKQSLFTTAPKLFGAINAMIANHEDYSPLLRRASRTPLLAIDDIDKAKHSPFREEIYFSIVDERVKRGLPIALSTNKLDDLEEFVGGAVASRLKVGQQPIEMVGDDYREGLDA